MTKARERERAGLQSSLRAVTTWGRNGKPKIGVEEFMSVAERFGLSKGALKGIRTIVEKEEWGAGPFLAHYYANIKESKVSAYERTARELFGARYATGVSSGTGALHCAMVAAGVGPGTEVIVPAVGFFATAAAVVMAKGVPIFCDIDDSFHMDPTKIEKLITKRTVAMAPTHVMGSVCDMDPIMKVAKKHKLKVVEDCAQACGATYKGRHVGVIGDLGCFSIAAYKIIGGGEAGLVLTGEKRLWERINGVAEAGGLWRPDRFAPPRYENELFCGTNYRMSELEAAVDVVQLRKAPATVKRFNTAKKRILQRLKTYKEITPQRLNDADGEVGYLIRFYPESFALGQRIADDLRANGITCAFRGTNQTPDWHLYSDMHAVVLKAKSAERECSFHCPHYKELGGHVEYRKGDCPVADDLYNRVIGILLNQWYTASDCREVGNIINGVLKKHCTPDSAGRPWRAK